MPPLSDLLLIGAALYIVFAELGFIITFCVLAAMCMESDAQ